jgi:hypothetical protein
MREARPIKTVVEKQATKKKSKFHAARGPESLCKG